MHQAVPHEVGTKQQENSHMEHNGNEVECPLYKSDFIEEHQEHGQNNFKNNVAPRKDEHHPVMIADETEQAFPHSAMQLALTEVAPQPRSREVGNYSQISEFGNAREKIKGNKNSNIQEFAQPVICTPTCLEEWDRWNRREDEEHASLCRVSKVIHEANDSKVHIDDSTDGVAHSICHGELLGKEKKKKPTNQEDESQNLQLPNPCINASTAINVFTNQPRHDPPNIRIDILMLPGVGTNKRHNLRSCQHALFGGHNFIQLDEKKECHEALEAEEGTDEDQAGIGPVRHDIVGNALNNGLDGCGIGTNLQMVRGSLEFGRGGIVFVIFVVVAIGPNGAMSGLSIFVFRRRHLREKCHFILVKMLAGGSSTTADGDGGLGPLRTALDGCCTTLFPRDATIPKQGKLGSEAFDPRLGDDRMVANDPVALFTRALDITASSNMLASILVILDALHINRLIILINGSPLLPSRTTATGTIQNTVVSIHDLAYPNAEAKDDEANHTQGPATDEPNILVHLGGRQEGELQPLEDVRTANGRGHPTGEKLVGQGLPLVFLDVSVVTHLIDRRLLLVILLVTVVMILLLLVLAAQGGVGRLVHDLSGGRGMFLAMLLLLGRKLLLGELFAKLALPVVLFGYRRCRGGGGSCGGYAHHCRG
mmetsp:Transcript_11099/g.31208  ORF Transcript_11099/g.31208 Transcript_11099/m.31208 type:complete len:652 (-) Transcript_11099:389-2344(-)